MFLIGRKDDFAVWFYTMKQEYIVTKNRNILIRDKYKFADVKSYLN